MKKFIAMFITMVTCMSSVAYAGESNAVYKYPNTRPLPNMCTDVTSTRTELMVPVGDYLSQQTSEEIMCKMLPTDKATYEKLCKEIPGYKDACEFFKYRASNWLSLSNQLHPYEDFDLQMTMCNSVVDGKFKPKDNVSLNSIDYSKYTEQYMREYLLSAIFDFDVEFSGNVTDSLIFTDYEYFDEDAALSKFDEYNLYRYKQSYGVAPFNNEEDPIFGTWRRYDCDFNEHLTPKAFEIVDNIMNPNVNWDGTPVEANAPTGVTASKPSTIVDDSNAIVYTLSHKYPYVTCNRPDAPMPKVVCR